MAIYPAWWSWKAVLNKSHKFIKLQADSNILASPEAGGKNCLPYVLAPRRFPASQEEKDKDKQNNNKKRPKVHHLALVSDAIQNFMNRFSFG